MRSRPANCSSVLENLSKLFRRPFCPSCIIQVICYLRLGSKAHSGRFAKACFMCSFIQIFKPDIYEL